MQPRMHRAFKQSGVVIMRRLAKNTGLARFGQRCVALAFVQPAACDRPAQCGSV
jgi:hypothetical protein